MINRVAVTVLLVTLAASSAADGDAGLAYYTLMRTPEAGLADADHLTPARRGHMAEYLVEANAALGERLWEVTHRLGCKNGPVPVEQKKYLQYVLGEIYSANLRQSMYRFELLYGEEGMRLLDDPGVADGSVASMVELNLARCEVERVQTAQH